jgi:acetoin utilization deacetylase AcuC-like enzyme
LIVYCSDEHLGHSPTAEVWGGRGRTHPEVPERVEEILRCLRSYSISKPGEIGREVILKVHSKRYLEFLEQTSSELVGSREAFPFVFPREGGEPVNYMARRGYYSLDTVTPILRGTYAAAIAAASCAVSGARLVAEGGGPVYCLCRPPGHHASGEMMGGYCYLNNSAIAASELGPGKRAILDIDAHHGNGTQRIYYEDPSVLTCSVHGNPRTRFPYLWGYSDERGNGPGLGYNLNRPLPGESAGKRWISAIEVLLERIRAYDPAFLVVSLGLDGVSEDRNGPFKLKEGDYALAGELISEMHLPTCIVQEGGYHLPSIGKCVRAFLEKWDRS